MGKAAAFVRQLVAVAVAGAQHRFEQPCLPSPDYPTDLSRAKGKI